MKGLTAKQRNILNFIQDFIKTHQYSPSYREIMQHFSFSSPGSVYKYVQTLKRKGILTAETQCSRSLSVVGLPSVTQPVSEIELPLMGHISAGYPIELFAQPQTLAVPSSLVYTPEKTYLLRARGDSLQEEFIRDGDLLLIEAKQEAESGETIIGLINQHETIIKCYYPEGQYIRLEGYHHRPLILRYESLQIQGVLVGLIRAY